MLTCRLFSRKNSFPKSGPLLKGLVSRFAPQSALLAPSSATAAAFNSPDSSPTPAKRRPPNKVHLKRCALRHAAAAPPHGAPPTPLTSSFPTQKRRTAYAARRQFSVKIREALNKSRHASYLHIFRLIARKLLEIHQVFLRHFHTITGGGFRYEKSVCVICIPDLISTSLFLDRDLFHNDRL